MGSDSVRALARGMVCSGSARCVSDCGRVLLGRSAGRPPNAPTNGEIRGGRGRQPSREAAPAPAEPSFSRVCSFRECRRAPTAVAAAPTQPRAAMSSSQSMPPPEGAAITAFLPAVATGLAPRGLVADRGAAERLCEAARERPDSLATGTVRAGPRTRASISKGKPAAPIPLVETARDAPAQSLCCEARRRPTKDACSIWLSRRWLTPRIRATWARLYERLSPYPVRSVRSRR